MYFTVPEVAGRTYEEIDELFEEGVPTRQFKQYRTRVQIAEEGEDTPVGIGKASVGASGTV